MLVILQIQVSSDQNLWNMCLYIADDTTSSSIGLIMGQYKDPYKPSSIKGWQKGFEHDSIHISIMA